MSPATPTSATTPTSGRRRLRPPRFLAVARSAVPAVRTRRRPGIGRAQGVGGAQEAHPRDRVMRPGSPQMRSPSRGPRAGRTRAATAERPMMRGFRGARPGPQTTSGRPAARRPRSAPKSPTSASSISRRRGRGTKAGEGGGRACANDRRRGAGAPKRRTVRRGQIEPRRGRTARATPPKCAGARARGGANESDPCGPRCDEREAPPTKKGRRDVRFRGGAGPEN